MSGGNVPCFLIRRARNVGIQPFEELAASFEVSLECGKQKALPEPARTAQELEFAIPQQRLDIRRLIHIYIALLDEFREGGHSDGVLQFAHDPQIFRKYTKKLANLQIKTEAQKDKRKKSLPFV